MQKTIVKKVGICLYVLLLFIMSALPVFAAENGKTLYFEEQNGKMVWNPVRGDDGNWFMSFTNMVPGGEYEDILTIQNGSGKTYKLYLQAIPIQQSEKKDDLLELIHMKVALDEETLYQGSASGKAYEDGNLQEVMYLGTYEPKDKSTINVDLMLDKEVGMEYCELLTKVDWKFMVTEVSQPDNVEPIQPPKTGDDTPVVLYTVIMGSSFLILVLTAVRKKHDKGRG